MWNSYTFGKCIIQPASNTYVGPIHSNHELDKNEEEEGLHRNTEQIKKEILVD